MGGVLFALPWGCINAGVGAVCCCVSRNIGKGLDRFDHQVLLRRVISQSWAGTVNKSLTSSSVTEPRHVPTVTCGYASVQFRFWSIRTQSSRS